MQLFKIREDYRKLAMGEDANPVVEACYVHSLDQQMDQAHCLMLTVVKLDELLKGIKEDMADRVEANCSELLGAAQPIPMRTRLRRLGNALRGIRYGPGGVPLRPVAYTMAPPPCAPLGLSSHL